MSLEVLRRLPGLALVTFSTLLVPADARGADYFSTNTHCLANFWAAAENTNKPVTIVCFGDSVADSYRSPTFHLMNKFVARLGTAGYSLNTYRNTSLVVLTNGSFHVYGGKHWFSYYTELPPGSSVWWETQGQPGGVRCDQAGIFYVTQPTGGEMRVSVSTNGGPWTQKLVLDGYSSTSMGRFTNFLLAPNYYRLRVDNDTGTNIVLGPHRLMTQTNGVHVVFMDMWGLYLGQVSNIAASVRHPIFEALQPDLLIWHMKEPGDLRTRNHMRYCEAWWRNSAPKCDVIYIGTHWGSIDTNTTTTIDQNSVVRSIAVEHGRAYADLMLPTVSYPWLLTNGLMHDTVHLTSAGGLQCANIMWDELGFYALGLNRRITLQPNGPQLQLSYQVTTNALYRLERSTNLQSWSPVLTNAVSSANFTTNLTSSPGPVYYRLGLTPR